MATPPNYQSVPDLDPYTPGAISTHEAWRTSPYGSSPGGSVQKPAFAPKGDVMAPGSTHVIPDRSDLNNGAAGGSTGTTGGYDKVALSSMDQAIKTYESMSGPAKPGGGGGGQNVYTDAQPTDPNDTWRYGSPADKARSGGGGSYSAAPQQRVIAPMKALEAPELPEYKGIGEYKPPEEDESVYKGARREAMGAGMRELREGTREAISSSQSLDNPNARSKFIQQALKGYGQGLEQVAKGASSEARNVAGRKRAEQIDVYRTNYTAKSDVYLKNYQNQINTIAANFASQQNAQTANFNANLDPNTTVRGMGGAPGTSGIPTGQDMYNQMFGGSTN